MKLEYLAKINNYKCYWCKGIFNLSELSKDHIETSVNKKRIKNGGYVLACKVCNNKRGNIKFNNYKLIIKYNL